MKKCLNLGCGSDIKQSFTAEEWINIDFQEREGILFHDLRKSLPFYMNTIDHIYTSHLVEHFNRYEWLGILADWYRALKWMGTIEIHCPDLEQSCKLFLRGENQYTGIVPIHAMIYGSQENEGQMHKQGFSKLRMVEDLNFIGFREINAYNSTSADDWELTAKAIKC